MSGSKGPRNRCAPGERRQRTTVEAAPGSSPLDWEARALSQVRGHVRDLAGPGGVQAGWETDTITRLEDYFDRGEV